MSETLLPCPYCSSMPLYMTVSDPAGVKLYVLCEGCRVTTRLVESQAEALALWNRRIAELESRLKYCPECHALEGTVNHLSAQLAAQAAAAPRQPLTDEEIDACLQSAITQTMILLDQSANEVVTDIWESKGFRQLFARAIESAMFTESTDQPDMSKNAPEIDICASQQSEDGNEIGFGTIAKDANQHAECWAMAIERKRRVKQLEALVKEILDEGEFHSHCIEFYDFNLAAWRTRAQAALAHSSWTAPKEAND